MWKKEGKGEEERGEEWRKSKMQKLGETEREERW